MTNNIISDIGSNLNESNEKLKPSDLVADYEFKSPNVEALRYEKRTKRTDANDKDDAFSGKERNEAKEKKSEFNLEELKSKYLTNNNGGNKNIDNKYSKDSLENINVENDRSIQLNFSQSTRTYNNTYNSNNENNVNLIQNSQKLQSNQINSGEKRGLNFSKSAAAFAKQTVENVLNSPKNIENQPKTEEEMFLLNNEIDNENSTIMKTRRILGYGSNQSSHANFCGKNVENCPGEGRENDGKKEEGIGNMGGVREINDRNNDKYKGEYRRSVEHMERRKEKYELPDTDRDDLIPYNNHYEDKVNKYNKILENNPPPTAKFIDANEVYLRKKWENNEIGDNQVRDYLTEVQINNNTDSYKYNNFHYKKYEFKEGTSSRINDNSIVDNNKNVEKEAKKGIENFKDKFISLQGKQNDLKNKILEQKNKANKISRRRMGDFEDESHFNRSQINDKDYLNRITSELEDEVKYNNELSNESIQNNEDYENYYSVYKRRHYRTNSMDEINSKGNSSENKIGDKFKGDKRPRNLGENLSSSVVTYNKSSVNYNKNSVKTGEISAGNFNNEMYSGGGMRNIINNNDNYIDNKYNDRFNQQQNYYSNNIQRSNNYNIIYQNENKQSNFGCEDDYNNDNRQLKKEYIKEDCNSNRINIINKQSRMNDDTYKNNSETMQGKSNSFFQRNNAVKFGRRGNDWDKSNDIQSKENQSYNMNKNQHFKNKISNISTRPSSSQNILAADLFKNRNKTPKLQKLTKPNIGNLSDISEIKGDEIGIKRPKTRGQGSSGNEINYKMNGISEKNGRRICTGTDDKFGGEEIERGSGGDGLINPNKNIYPPNQYIYPPNNQISKRNKLQVCQQCSKSSFKNICPYCGCTRTEDKAKKSDKNDKKESALFNLFCDFLEQDKIIEKHKEKLALCEDASLPALFEFFDLNQRNSISANDLYQTFKKLGVQMHSADVRLLLKRFDLNLDGRLDYEEFCDLILPKKYTIANIMNERKNENFFSDFRQDTLKKISNVFQKLIDAEKSNEKFRNILAMNSNSSAFELFNNLKKNYSNGIYREDIYKFLESKGKYIKQSELEMLMERLDKNQNGIIEYSEFLQEIVPKI